MARGKHPNFLCALKTNNSLLHALTRTDRMTFALLTRGIIMLMYAVLNSIE